MAQAQGGTSMHQAAADFKEAEALKLRDINNLAGVGATSAPALAGAAVSSALHRTLGVSARAGGGAWARQLHASCCALAWSSCLAFHRTDAPAANAAACAPPPPPCSTS